MFVLVVVSVAGFVGLRRRLHLARAARRAAAALDEAAREAADGLKDRAIPRQRPAAEVAVGYDALTAEEFEEAIAALCERATVALPSTSWEGPGIWVPMSWPCPLTGAGRHPVQARDSHRVGSQDLQRFGGTCFTVHEADVAVLVTTSDFTTPAVEYADQCGIVCVDRETLQAWTDGTGPRSWEANELLHGQR